MKRWRYNIIKHSEIAKTEFDTKIESDKIIFENTIEYKDIKKDLENAQKVYDQSILDDKMDETVYLELLEQVQSVFDTLINSQIVVKCEDSGVVCPQLGERVLFIKDYREIDLLEKDIIQLSIPFYFDVGTKLIIITKDNYKDYNINNILIEKPDKYKSL